VILPPIFQRNKTVALSKPDNFNPKLESPADDQPSLANAELSELSTYPLSSFEFSTQLETSVPLEAPRRIYRLPVQPVATSNPAFRVPPLAENIPTETLTPDLSNQEDVKQKLERQVVPQPDCYTRPAETIIPLLEERLVVDRYKRKVGEVVVRKEIETRIVEVEVRREKLIVEQVSPEFQQLAVVDLGSTQSGQINAAEAELPATVEANFTSAQAAIEFLQALAVDSDGGLQEIRVSVVLKTT
jgi:stress response protein YsnF